MALLNTYQDSLFALSLRRLFSSYSGPLVRVVRESDFVEVDVLPDANGEISYDSFLSRPSGTQATTLGQFLNIDGYTDADSLGSVYEGRLIIIYDQSVGANHVSYDTFSNAFLFVEHSLPSVFPNSTGIIKVSGVPSFFAVGTSKTFTPYTLLGTEYSLHFLSGQVGANPIGFRVQGIDTNGFFTSPYDVLLYTNLATTVFQPSGSTDVFNVNDVYINTEQCNETQNNVFEKPTNQNESTVINSIEFAFFDNATTQANFSAAVEGPSFYIVANSFYADIIVYEGYDSIRRLFIEDLYSTAANNVETKLALSSFSFEEDNAQDNSFIAQFGAPAAAYSVRDLRGGVNDQGDRVTKIMRVRREIDHAEADVYPDSTGWLSLNSRVEIVPAITDNLEGGTGDEIDSQAVTLGEFVNDPDYDNPDNLVSATTAKVVVWYDQSDPDYLVDNLPESIQERGAPIRIRVIGGTYNNYEFDVYFDNNETISLSSYVADTYEITDSNGQVTAAISNGTLQTLLDAGMTEAAVCVWYDQSGSGNDASQDVSSSQPKIVSERTNLLLQSNKFDTTWSKTNVSVTSGQAGYDGTNDAWKIEGTGSSVFSYLDQSDTTTHVKTKSIYAKAGSVNWISIWSASSNKAYFDLANETTGVLSGSYVIDSSITSVGGGWYRCEVAMTESAQHFYIIPATSDNGTSLSAGEYVYIQDAQLEAGYSATDYIETTTSAVTVSGVVTKNGKPAVQFDGSDDALLANHADLYGQLRLDIFTHYFSNDDNYRLYAAEATGGYYSFVSQDGSTVTVVEGFGNQPDLYVNGAQVSITYGTTTRDDIHTAVTTNGSSNSAGSLETVMNGDTVPWVGFGISSYTASSLFAGEIAEIVIYNTPQDGNREGIEGDINGYYDIYGSGNTGVNIKLLDDGFYPDAAAAYSLRKLRTAYGGPVNLSGRKDAIQNVSNAQPKIYDSVTGVVVIGGNPAVQFDSSSHHMDMNYADLYGQSRLDSFIHYQSTDNAYILYNDETGGGGRYSFVVQNGSTSTGIRDQYGSPDLYVNGTQVSVSYGTTTRGDLHTAIVTNGVSATAGAIETHLNSVTTNWGAFGISAYSGYGLNGKIAEMIFYNTNQSGNREGIESNMNSAFQIYAANFSSVLDTVPLAKAAYSIRRLTKNYIGPIITVTNGSTTKDFYADFWGNLDVDALTSFANGGTLSVTKWWDQSGEGVHLLTTSTRPTLTIANNEVSVNTTNKFYEPLLDRYEGAAAAYSLRILKGDYTGPLVRVRRDGTNTEVDVYPDENLTISLNSPVLNVTETTTDVTASPADTLATTLGEFVAATGHSNPDSLAASVGAFVVVWYDQAGSTAHLQQTSAARQGAIVMSSGTVLTDSDGLPYVNAIVSTYDNPIEISQPFTAFAVAQFGATYRRLMLGGVLWSPDTTNNRFNGGLVLTGTNPLNFANKELYGVLANGASSEMRYNGTTDATGNVGTNAITTSTTIFSQAAPSNSGPERAYEMVIFSGSQSGNFTGIESNINDHYQIPNFNATASTAQTVAVYNNAINTTVDLNATYTDLKEIIKYE